MEFIFEANEKYCLCLKDVEKHQSRFSIIESSDYLSSYKSSTESFEIDPRTEVRRRKRRTAVLEVDKWIEEICKLLANGTLKFIVGISKVKSPYFNLSKPRSSNYIGVSKNGENWQVLINCGKAKKYIGTFYSEVEAAITYDFYWIWLHSSMAKTNFTYDLKLLKEMMECYDTKRKKFWASKLINMQ